MIVQEVILDLEVFSDLKQDGKGDVKGLDGLIVRNGVLVRVWNPGHVHRQSDREIERIESGLVDHDQPMPAQRSDDAINGWD